MVATGQKSEAPDVKPSMPAFPEDCGACDGAKTLMSAFQRHTRKGKDQAPPPAASTSSQPSLPTTSAAAHPTEDPSAALPSQPPAAPASASPTRLECPVGSEQLGRSSWTFLHTMAAYYPATPSTAQQSLMRSFVAGVAEYYPCHVCAAHLRQQVEDTPPEVSSNVALSGWFCRIHNEINELLGKPLFDCSRVMERWRTGPAAGPTHCDRSRPEPSLEEEGGE